MTKTTGTICPNSDAAVVGMEMEGERDGVKKG